MNPTRLFMTTLLTASLAVSCFAELMPHRLRTKLDQLVGTWKVDTKIRNEVVTETVTLKWGTNKNAVAHQGLGESFSTGRALNFSGVLGWSNVEKRIAEHGFDSKGGTMTASHNIEEETWIGSVESSHRLFPTARKSLQRASVHSSGKPPINGPSLKQVARSTDNPRRTSVACSEKHKKPARTLSLND